MDVQIQSIEPDYGGIKVVWKKNAKIEPIYKIRAYSGVDLVGEYKVHGCQFLYHPEDPLKKYFFKIWPDSETVDSENLERNSTKECSLCYHVGNDVYVDYTRKLNPHYDIFGGFECESTIRRDVAVKIFDIREPDKQSQKDLKLEMGNLRDVDHENIISYVRSNNSTDFSQAFIAVQMCSSVTLFEVVRDHQNMPLKTVKQIFLHITNGLKYLHEKGIMHRNLNPSTIWLSGDRDFMQISEFGFSKRISLGTKSTTDKSCVFENTGWDAPEMGDKAKESSKLDIFSLGNIFYYTLTRGKHPFGSTFKRVDNIRNGEFNLDDLDPITDYMILSDLLSKMIDFDQNKRPSAKKILKHPFFWEDDKKIELCFDALKLKDDLQKINGYEKFFENWVKGVKKKISAESDLFLKLCEGQYENSIFGYIDFLHKIFEDRSKDGIFCSIEGIWGFFSRQYPDLIRIVFELMRDKLNQVPDARIYPLSDIDLPSVEKMIYEETDSIELKNTTMNFGYDSFYSEALVHVSEHIPDPDENVFPIGPMLNCSMEQNLREEVQITMKTVCQNTENGAVKLFHVVGGQPIKKSNLLPKKNCVSCSLKKFEQLYLGIEKSAIQHVHFKVVAALYYNNFCEMILNFHIQNDCRYHSVMHAGFRCAVEFNAFSVKIGQNLRLQLFCDSHSNLNEQFVEFELDESHLDRSAHSKKVELKYFQSDLPTGPVVAEILVDDKKVESQNFNISSFPLSEIFLFQ
uniref:uncharacterized protein LOC120326393 isoform X1 n=1 Tax=Styela clava TaxID=7725 RepID=UPI00193A23E9|nr:uncharacterized protein LOC120326393 isoform X1 [Styela clava]XP_039248607.1 uncharacterized protein LOC120326393 isoform X1 [Styela clava]